jgi:hypothetical protein
VNGKALVGPPPPPMADGLCRLLVVMYAELCITCWRLSEQYWFKAVINVTILLAAFTTGMDTHDTLTIHPLYTHYTLTIGIDTHDHITIRYTHCTLHSLSAGIDTYDRYNWDG